ncbi:hypothetical protein BH23CHL7_BH23CHL7_08280 [soil metagenome]
MPRVCGGGAGMTPHSAVPALPSEVAAHRHPVTTTVPPCPRAGGHPRCHTYRPRLALVTVTRRFVSAVLTISCHDRKLVTALRTSRRREVPPHRETIHGDHDGRASTCVQPAHHGSRRQARTTVHEPSAMQTEPRFRLTEASAVRASFSPRVDLSGAPRRLAAVVPSSAAVCRRRSSALRCRREYAASLVAPPASRRAAASRSSSRRDGDGDGGGDRPALMERLPKRYTVRQSASYRDRFQGFAS